jgi:putative addiction module killer protein
VCLVQAVECNHYNSHWWGIAVKPFDCNGRARLESGNTSAVKWLGVVGEYRIDWGPGYRIYLAKGGADLVILLGGGTKKRQSRDIERAKGLWSEYKARKGTASRSKEKR